MEVKSLSRFDDHLRRISTVLFGAGMAIVLLVANSQLVRPQLMHRPALNLVALAAGISVVAILLFPWRRYNRNLFLVATLDGLCLIVLAVLLLRRMGKPFLPVLLLRSGLLLTLLPAPIAALGVGLTVLFSLSPQLYDPDIALDGGEA